MSDPDEGPQVPVCDHGAPPGGLCAECIGDVVRSVLGIASAREAGAAPTPLAANAIQSHEMLIAHVAAGFTRAEAMQIILLVYAITLLRSPTA